MLTVDVLKFQTIYSILFWPKFCCFFFFFFFCAVVFKILSVWVFMSSLIWVYTVCICHFVRNFSEQNLSTFSIYRMVMIITLDVKNVVIKQKLYRLHHNLFITILLENPKQICCIQAKLYRLYSKMIVNGQFCLDTTLLGYTFKPSILECLMLQSCLAWKQSIIRYRLLWTLSTLWADSEDNFIIFPWK